MIKVDLVAAMGCSKCGKPGVIFQEYSGLHLCPQHFKEDLLHKAKKTVRQNHWLVPGTQYAVALSGGRKSCALLGFMHALAGKRKDISLVAVTIKNNDPEAMENAKAISESFGIRWFGIPGDKVTIQHDNRFDAANKSPFMAHSSTECQLTLMAEELQFDALVMGYALEDHAEWVLWNAISGKTIQETGSSAEARRRVQVTRPFMHIPGKELELYTQLFLEDYNVETQPETGIHVDDPISTILARFYSRHPGVPYALVNIGEQVKKFRDQCS
ncbi:MAG: ATP-binding protein [Methanomicrobiales archaeon]